ncbi:MAG: erythromycin esterase family protein, partial [Planctomycetaceae bacterium]|nr:erythromycin esterase family protein [Planctomycetaceae bacterium]
HPKIAGFDTAVEITRRALGERFTEAFKKKINLAHIPSNPPTLEGLEDYIRGRGESRELAEAENVGWIQRQNGKVLVYEANGHLQKAPKDIRVGPLDVGKIEEVAGTYLMREYGNDFVLIGSTVNSFVDPVTGETLTKLEGVPIAPTESCKDCLERPLAQAAKELAFPLFLIDLRSAGGAALDAIDRDRENRFGHGGFQRFNSYEAYDALVFFDKASLGITLISCIKRSVNGQLHLNPTCL